MYIIECLSIDVSEEDGKMYIELVKLKDWWYFYIKGYLR